MMILRTSNASPFGRKARLAAALLGLDKKIDVLPANGNDPNDPIRVENPLGKMPVLTLEDGTHLFDSPVILEYFDVFAWHRSKANGQTLLQAVEQGNART